MTSATPRERPLIFSAPMVRAILAGAKTQTRRVLRADAATMAILDEHGAGWSSRFDVLGDGYGGVHRERNGGTLSVPLRCPYGSPKERLWVRETWFAESKRTVFYRATHTKYEDDPDSGWRPSLFMPRWASRITLEVTEVRVQRLHEINEDDARAEGVDCHHHAVGADRPTYRDSFRLLWDSINGKPRPMLDDDGEPVLDDNGRRIMVASRAWASNPWVWAISFRRLP